MSRTLNLGILAHVDAGKTTLTERLLFEAGAIGAVGRVDDGTTLTDSLDLERRRGITIRSAVASLMIGDVSVNLIDTPGHPDFIAEVDRVLGVLDGAVLVISAVEGVQPQTRVLMRALRRLGVPTLIFINKIDRGGADVDAVLRAIERRMAVRAVPMVRAAMPGTRAATAVEPDEGDLRAALIDALVDHDDDLFEAYVDDEARVTRSRLRAALAEQTATTLVCPVYVGSAMTGTGVASLMDGLVTLLPTAEGDDAGPRSGSIFKIERGAAGEKIAYVRMFSGTAHVRERVHEDGADKVTGISVFERGAWVRRDTVRAGEIGKLWGLAHVKVGELIGVRRGDGQPHHFAPPTLEARLTPDRHEDHVALRVALAQLVEQDPLINVRSEESGELAVSLYGEVQKEVIEATLAADYGIAVSFRETTPLYIERPARTGEAEEVLNTPENPFHATIGLRVGAGRRRYRVPSRRRLPVGAAVRLPQPRRVRDRDGAVRSRCPAGGPVRLVGQRLRGHDDQQQLQRGRRSAVPAWTDQHRRRFPQADTVGVDAGAAQCRHAGVRTDLAGTDRRARDQHGRHTRARSPRMARRFTRKPSMATTSASRPICRPRPCRR